MSPLHHHFELSAKPAVEATTDHPDCARFEISSHDVGLAPSVPGGCGYHHCAHKLDGVQLPVPQLKARLPHKSSDNVVWHDGVENVSYIV